MKKYLVSWDFLFITIVCFFGGMLDGFSFLFRDGTFCLVQTGNLVKCVIFYIKGEIYEASYSLIIIITFCIFIFLFYLLFKLLKSKNINYHFVSMPVMAILLIPSIVWKFDNLNYLSFKNIISGCSLSMVGSIMAVCFKNVKFKFDSKISFNSAMMTGNMRSLMVCFADFIRFKDKEKGFQSFCYLTMIISFVLGILISSICCLFISGSWNFYSIFILLYLLIIAMIIIFHYRYKWIKVLEKENQNEMIS